MKYNNKKYKIVNAKVNKQLINDELELQPITSKKPPILQLILDRLDKIDNRLDEHSKRFNKIEITLEEHGKAIHEIRNVLDKHEILFKEHGWIK